VLPVSVTHQAVGFDEVWHDPGWVGCAAVPARIVRDVAGLTRQLGGLGGGWRGRGGAAGQKHVCMWVFVCRARKLIVARIGGPSGPRRLHRYTAPKSSTLKSHTLCPAVVLSVYPHPCCPYCV
jgi:hypothetical protein